MTARERNSATGLMASSNPDHAEPLQSRPLLPRRASATNQPPLVERSELILLTVLLGGYASFIGLELENPQPLNLAGPLALMLILGRGCRRALLVDHMALWQPVFWFRVACIAYYGFGALVPYVTNDTTKLYIMSLYAFSDEEVFKTNLINAICIWLVLVTIFVVGSAAATQRSAWTPDARFTPRSNILMFTLGFLIVGGIARYLFVLPASLGMTDATISAFAGLPAKFYNVGLFLLVLAGLRGRAMLLLLAAILLVVDLGVATLTFSKAEVLLALIFAFLAVLHQRLSTMRFLIGAAAVLSVFSVLGPLVQHGREQIVRQYGYLAGVSYGERLQYVQDYFAGHRTIADSGVNMAAARFSYANAAAMVVAWHDAGRTGNSLTNAFIVVVPRMIWPDKPSITEIGTELYTAATYNRGASISPGIFAEAYWNLGWLGLPTLMIPLGIALAIFSRFASAIMREERWLYLPVVMLGVQIGTRVDGWYVPDCIGAPATAFVAYCILRAMEGLVRRVEPARYDPLAEMKRERR